MRPALASLPEPDPRIQIMEVTPATARLWLAKSTGNRATRRTKLEQFTRSMVEGRWRLVGNPIAFDVTGRLIDGHHRLQAVVASETTQRFAVMFNVDPEALSVIDTGSARTPGDALAVLDGRANANVIASIASRALSWDKGFRWLSNYKATHDEIREYVNDPAHVHLGRAAEVGYYGRKYIPVQPTLLGLSFYLCANVDRANAEVFFIDELVEMVGLRPDDPAHVLRKRLTLDATKRGTAADFDKLALILSAWNHYRAGRRITKLQSPRGNGWTHANYPEPE